MSRHVQPFRHSQLLLKTLADANSYSPLPFYKPLSKMQQNTQELTLDISWAITKAARRKVEKQQEINNENKAETLSQ